MEVLCRSKIKNVIIEVVLADITKIKVDAIVNPANSLMIMGGGVAGAIKRYGGSVIEEEAKKYAPVPVGRAIETSAGRLPAKYVIHAPTMERPAMRTNTDNVKKAVKAALDKARNLNLSSIAFPGMGTGVGGVPFKDAAKVMVSMIINHINEGTSLKRILLVTIDKELALEFCNSLKSYGDS